jgi:hypothetical protein
MTGLVAAERASASPSLSNTPHPNNAAATAKQMIQAATTSRQSSANAPGWYHIAYLFEVTSCTTGFCDSTYSAMASRSPR